MRSFGWIVLTLCAACPAPVAAAVEFKDGDRVVLIGGTFIERAQRYGYVEAELTAALAAQGKSVTFRNLGWSGDTVWAESRGIFDPPAEGYKRMIAQVLELRPTLLILNYGGNEAFAGEAGLTPFVKQYEQLLNDLAPTGARLVLISPLAHLDASDRHPDPREFNAKLPAYRDAIRDLAVRRKADFVDLSVPLGTKAPLGSSDAPTAIPVSLMTDTGVHLNAFGYKTIAQVLCRELVGEPQTATIALSTNVTEAEFPRVLLPGEVEPSIVLKGAGLKPGRYAIEVDGEAVAEFSHDQWAEGVPGYLLDIERFDALRQSVVAKDELYFHRWRPQNVTYLFLFRKHEQGQNAKEIPEFDPLVESKEREIAELSKPVKRKLRLVAVE